MKLRIKGDSVRIRLSKTEVQSLASGDTLQDSTSFTGNRFGYSVIPVNAGDQLSAAFIEGIITLYVPQHLLQDWPTNSIIGFESNMPVNGATELHLLLEKDFKCVDASVAEDQSDFYENPEKNC